MRIQLQDTTAAEKLLRTPSKRVYSLNGLIRAFVAKNVPE